MNFDVDSRTILLVRHGSHAYGLNTATSDEDFKGVCVKPVAAYYGFTQRFEQYERMGNKEGGNLAVLKAHAGHDADVVVYSLDKFAALASDCNPNIIEVLHVDDSDVVKQDAYYGWLLREHRYDFVSKKAKFTFSGYAHAQLKRIMTHRKWLLDPPKQAPSRAQFGLSEDRVVNKAELGAFDSLFDLKTVDDEATSPERLVELVETGRNVLNVELPKDVITLFTREKAYRAALAHWEQFLSWQRSRNPKRAELEAKFGYDTKHGMHLLRLMKMCTEILRDGIVRVKRVDDRDELMAVRNGQVPYDELIERANNLQSQCEALYETSKLPKEPNRAKIDELIVEMTARYLREHG